MPTAPRPPRQGGRRRPGCDCSSLILASVFMAHRLQGRRAIHGSTTTLLPSGTDGMGEDARRVVPGATLYYEVRGSGPVPGPPLHLGGPTDAGMFADLAGRLADRYTVVSYCPIRPARPLRRRRLDGEPEDLPVSRLTRTMRRRSWPRLPTTGRTGVRKQRRHHRPRNFVARHPGLVRTLVAHG